MFKFEFIQELFDFIGVEYDTIREGIDVKELDIGILGISSDGENVTYEISSPDFSLSELPPIITKVQLTAKVFNSCKGIQTGVYRPCYVLTFDVEKYGDEWKYL